jgi:ParB/RepB/Spo0J family partition protein
MDDEFKEIPLDEIYWPDSTDITEQQINNMAASILVHGQIEPVVVCPHDEKNQYRGVVGRLRWEGMKYRWRGEPEGKTILARIHHFKDESEILMWQLAENLHRREVTAMQKAHQYRELHTLLTKEHNEEATLGTLVSAIEESTGNPESVKTVQHYLSLTKLEPRTQEVLTSEKLPLRAGLELLRIEDPKRQVKAAEEIKKKPNRYKTVQDIKWHVEGYITDQQRDKQRKRLNKKAEELRKQGKAVIIEAPYGDTSWEERQKYHQFWGEIPAECKDCPKMGILLSGNFQQKPICTDTKCYENMETKKHKKQVQEQKEIEQKFDEERIKVYGMEPDVRHWRLAVFGLIDHWKLQRLLQVKEARFARDDDVLWLALNKLDEKECQRLLIRKAIEEILTGPQSWGDDSPVKKWTVCEFQLTPKVFLKELTTADRESLEG